jgi:hypothetical protein
MRLFLALTLLAVSSFTQAAIKTAEIPYQSADGSQLIGYYAPALSWSTNGGG